MDNCDAQHLDLVAELFDLEDFKLALEEVVEPDPAARSQLQPATECAVPIDLSLLSPLIA